KSDAAEGFEQIIDFLSGSYIHYALTVSPPIYISCVNQFWNSVLVKRSGDVTSQWKFSIHTILQSLSAKRTSWNKFSTTMASVVICLSKGQRFNFSKYIFDSLVRNVDNSSKFYMAGKGFSRIETPLFKSMLVVRDVTEEAQAQVLAQRDNVQEPAAEEVVPEVVPPTPTSSSPSSPPHQPPCPPQHQDAEGSSLLFQQILATCSALALRVEGLENDKAAQQLEIVKLKAMVKKLEKINKDKSSKLRRLKKVGTSQRVESSDDMENVFNQGR
nr:hypothetical protein [Tanacetum cinerariifolium]